MQAALVFPRRAQSDVIEAVLEATPRMTAHARLAIYQRSYYARLLKCMEDQFPALRYALGAPLFADFAGEYLRACPSQSYTLYALGARFPAYLEENRPDHALPVEERESWIDFMVDLARLEREVFRVYDAPGHEGQPYANDQIIDANLVLQPCVSLHAFRYPVADYYTQVRRELKPEFPVAQPSYYALVRKDFQTRMISLELPQHIFLTALVEGHCIAKALAKVAQASAQPLDATVRAWGAESSSRKNWIAAGMFVAREDRVV